MIASVEYLAWARSIGVDPLSGPPLSESQRHGGRQQRLSRLAERIERAEAEISHSTSDPTWRRRMQAKLQRLEDERDRVEADGWDFQEALDTSGHECDVCGTPILASATDYGAGRCGPCLNPNPTRRAAQ